MEPICLSIKPIIKKCIANGDDIQLALLNIIATPLDTKLPSSAELLFGRQITTTLPNYVTRQQHPNYSEHMWQQQKRSAIHVNIHKSTVEISSKPANTSIRHSSKNMVSDNCHTSSQELLLQCQNQ